MRNKFLKSFALSLLFVPTFAFAEAKSVAVDTNVSEIKWVGKKVTGAHDGVVKLESGAIVVENGAIKSGEFVIDMNSIVNKDIESEKYRNKLVGHLKSDDFFNVAKFATAKFNIDSVSPVKGQDSQFNINGKLTVKGIEKPLSFQATIKEEGGKHKANAKLKLDRSKWDIRYNSSSFFDVAKLGDKLIYDDIEFELNLVTN